MGFNPSLQRDQKRLAETKARALPIDHPLRAKYLEWIEELDRRLSESFASDMPQLVGRATTSKKDAAEPTSFQAGIADALGEFSPLESRDLGLKVAGPVKLNPLIEMPTEGRKASARKHSQELSSTPVSHRQNNAALKGRRERLICENRILHKLLARYERQ